jgi:hypothetical protein
MPTFKKCEKAIHDLADKILNKFPSHLPLIETKCRVDLVFAYCDRDEDTDQPLNDAIIHQGRKALGLCRAIALKDRVLGRGDAEITLDGDWWTDATDAQKEALLDHELHHISIKTSKRVYLFDDLGRPKIKLRKHDVEVGWFACIADRHGAASQEQIQAAAIMEKTGQYFWPGLIDGGGQKAIEDTTVTLSAAGHAPVTMTGKEFSAAAKKIAGKK